MKKQLVVTKYTQMTTSLLLVLSTDRNMSDVRQEIICDILYDRVPDQQEFEIMVQTVLN